MGKKKKNKCFKVEIKSPSETKGKWKEYPRWKDLNKDDAERIMRSAKKVFKDGEFRIRSIKCGK